MGLRLKGDPGPQGPAGPSLNMKAAVADEASLPSSGNTPNDARLTSDTGHIHVWDGSAWQDAGQIQGPPGQDGAPGTPGQDGEDGAPGATGPVGPAGGTAFETVDVTENHTFTAANAGKLHEVNAVGAVVLTVPSDPTIPNKSVFIIKRIGTGGVSFTPASGVTLDSPSGYRVIRRQFCTAVLRKRGTDLWDLDGDLG